MIYDLHSHSTFSDGDLSPDELFSRAAEKGVSHLALTDHDTVAGLDQATNAAQKYKLTLIPGVEISCLWQDSEIHILGLNIDPNNTSLQKGLQNQREIRITRFQKMVDKLKQSGINGTEKIVNSYANGEHVGRPTVAKFLVDSGHCDYKEAYQSLGKGGKFYTHSNWIYMEHAVKWINESGGLAVIAHPDGYNLNLPSLRHLIRNFKEAGGAGIEVCYGACSKKTINRCGDLAKQYTLYGSSGSDFHRPALGIELGRLKPLPRGVEPVWNLF